MARISLTSELQILSFSPLSKDTCQVTGLTVTPDLSLNTLVIPETDAEGRKVVSIGDRAFAGITSLRRVDLPCSLMSIGNRAFAFCENLMEVSFGLGNGRGCMLSHIGDRAFMGCDCLTVLSLGELQGDLVCGKKAFAHCTRLRTAVLPMGMTELSEGIFEGCRSLMYVRLPEALTVIRTSAFSSCRTLPIVSLPACVCRVDDCAFSFCSSLETVVFPEGECMVSVSAFLDCPARPDFMKAV
ncbi:MAG: leucine-rich repeat domain-containing protein [Clostridia bacterium]|nr:leucine-rich repeat domain-containing protein [Clostridia bacterium]